METLKTIITAPCRLHFGLFALENKGNGDERSFGGLGAMIQTPSIKVRVEESDAFESSGFVEDKVRSIAALWLKNQLAFHGASEFTTKPGIQVLDDLPCKISITAPPQHVGLGVGTQLAMSIATALNVHFNRPKPGAAELALSLGRGRRSAVGSYGFATGGLIVDGGREPDAPFPDLAGRFDFPEQWRFVLVRPNVGHDFFGQQERAAFGDLTAPSRSERDELSRIARDVLIPALIDVDFRNFASSLGEFNRRSGEMFAQVQGGPFNGAEVTTVVDELQSAGFAGCGQSSWGPTIFVAVDSDAMAEEVRSAAKSIVKANNTVEDVFTCVTTVNNTGFKAG